MKNSYLQNTALNSHQFLRQIESLLTKENQIDFILHFKSGSVDSSWSLRNQRSQIHRRNVSCISMSDILKIDLIL